MKKLICIFVLLACRWASAQSACDMSQECPAAAGAAIVLSSFVTTVQASGHTCTVASITLSTGDSIAAASTTAGLAGSISATWNGTSMTQVGSGQGSTDVEGHVFTLNNVTGATGSLVMTKTNSADDSLSFNCTPVRITGLAVHALDVTHAAADTGGGSSTWDTGAATTGTANEGLLAFFIVKDNTGGTYGAWQNSFTRMTNSPAGQTTGCCAIDFASRVVSSTGSYTGQSTGNDTVLWLGWLLTFK